MMNTRFFGMLNLASSIFEFMLATWLSTVLIVMFLLLTALDLCMTQLTNTPAHHCPDDCTGYCYVFNVTHIKCNLLHITVTC